MHRLQFTHFAELSCDKQPVPATPFSQFEDSSSSPACWLADEIEIQNCPSSNWCSLISQEEAGEEEGVSLSAGGQTLMKDGVSYSVGDQVYVHPETFDQLEQATLAEVPDYAAKGRFHKVQLSL